MIYPSDDTGPGYRPLQPKGPSGTYSRVFHAGLFRHPLAGWTPLRKEPDMKHSVIFSLGVGAVLTMTLPAAAQSQCASREAVVNQLAERFGESRQSIGMAQGTITVTLPDGRMWIIAAGQAWEKIDEAVALGEPA